jgi:HEPN domain-containing protein
MKNITKEWIFFAENDIKTADSIINEARLTGQIVFHSQQAIEKYLKAYLTENNINFPKIHDLPKLYELAKQVKDLNMFTCRWPIAKYGKRKGDFRFR